MKTFLLFFGGITLAVLTSCQTRVGDFTLLSTRNVDMNYAKGYKVEQGKRVKGEDVVRIYCVVPVGSDDIKESVDRAIEAGGENCVGLADVVIKRKSWWIPYIYGRIGVVTEGTPVLKKQ